MSKILLLVNDVEIANQISNILLQDKFQVINEPIIEKGFSLIMETKPNLVILDVIANQPESRKLDYQIRSSQALEKLPILLISDNHQEYDLIPGFISTRLDDYIPFPFESEEFLMRIQNLLNRVEETKRA